MRTYRLPVLLAAVALLTACGGGGDTNAGGGGTPPTPIVPPSAAAISANSARIAELNAHRGNCDGTALQAVARVDALAIAAIRHAGWQAIDDATLAGHNITHNEPRSNALLTADYFVNRIRAANGGADISGWAAYSEGVSSTAGTTAIDNLWNTVYHRLPMMRHRMRGVGYGDMALARADYPSANVPALCEWPGNSPADNGYATLDYVGYSTPSITTSYWPGDGTTGVPRSFISNQETPDPVPARNVVGPPLHIILPVASGAFTVVNITLTGPGPTSISLRALAGGATPSGAAGNVTELVADSDLAAGELFAIPLTNPAESQLAAGSYSYRMQVTAGGTSFDTGNVGFTVP